MKGGYRYKKKRSLRTISTKFVHNRVAKSPTRKSYKRRKSHRRKGTRSTRKRRRTSRK